MQTHICCGDEVSCDEAVRNAAIIELKRASPIWVGEREIAAVAVSKKDLPNGTTRSAGIVFGVVHGGTQWVWLHTDVLPWEVFVGCKNECGSDQELFSRAVQGLISSYTTQLLKQVQSR